MIEQFCQEGYAVLAGALAPECVAELRGRYCDANWTRRDDAVLETDLYAHPALVAFLDAACERWSMEHSIAKRAKSLKRWHLDGWWDAERLPTKRPDRRCGVSLLWSLGRFDADNGATEMQTLTGRVIHVEMPPGSCLAFVNSHMLHRTGLAWSSYDERPAIVTGIGAVLRHSLPDATRRLEARWQGSPDRTGAGQDMGAPGLPASWRLAGPTTAVVRAQHKPG